MSWVGDEGSDMPARDRKLWAREEIMDAINTMIAEMRERRDLNADDEQALLRERDRVGHFLRFKWCPRCAGPASGRCSHAKGGV